MRVRAVVNPRAGVSPELARRAIERGHPRWRDFDVATTERPGHATELARAAVEAGAELVLSVGGDGTANEVARALIGTDVALGVVPAGSGNGLARALGIPRRATRALDAIEAGVKRRIDVGVLNGRPFLNVAGAGFDAAVGRAFHDAGVRGGRRGFLGYLRLSLRELRHYRAPRVELDTDAGVRTVRPFVLTFANGPQYGSGAVVNPGAKLDDGRLELVVVDEQPLGRLLLQTPRLFFGGIERIPGYLRLSLSRGTLRAGEPLSLHWDGDPGHATASILELRLEPRALVVVTAAATASDPAGPFS